jgi:hypothetical protein
MEASSHSKMEFNFELSLSLTSHDHFIKHMNHIDYHLMILDVCLHTRLFYMESNV